MRQHGPSSDQPDAQSAPLAAQLPGGRQCSFSFQIAKNDGSAVLVRQSLQLLLQQFLQGSGSVRHFRYLLLNLLHARFLFFPLPTVSHGFRPRGRIAGHAVEPVAHHPPRPNGSGLADQYDEGGLEAVFRVGLVVQDTAANTQDHRPVPPHQCREGGLVPLPDETLQQLAVGHAPLFVVGHGPAQVLEKRCQCFDCHRNRSPNGSSILYSHQRGILLHDFLAGGIICQGER